MNDCSILYVPTTAKSKEHSRGIRFSFLLLRKFGVHFYNEKGIFSTAQALYSVLTLISYCAILHVLNMLSSSMRAEVKGLFGFVAGFVDSWRVAVLMFSLVSHFIVVFRNKERFGRLYTSSYLFENVNYQNDNQVFASLLITICRAGMLVNLIWQHAIELRRYINMLYELLIVVGSYAEFLILLQYCTFLRIYSTKICILTRYLKTTLKSYRPIPNVIRNHDVLARHMDELNNLFGWQLFTGVTFIFIETTVNFYYTFYQILPKLFNRFRLRYVLYFCQNLLRGAFLTAFMGAIVYSTAGAINSVSVESE